LTDAKTIRVQKHMTLYVPAEWKNRGVWVCVETKEARLKWVVSPESTKKLVPRRLLDLAEAKLQGRLDSRYEPELT